MRRVVLTRTETSNSGTFGHIVTDSGLSLRSGELPWRNNEPGYSSIPADTYDVVWAQSPTKGWCYHVIKVPGRLDVEIHPGNHCGDLILGFRSDVKGCILLGTSVGPMNGQRAILCSLQGFIEFYRDLNQVPFQLVIKELY